jgi:UDPglucose 6-dehydrogenase/GDP-mannose 6-dehydrogenase
VNVSIIGAGYVGLVTGLCLAERGHRVTCVDIDEARILKLSCGLLPVYEKGLPELLQRNLDERFFPTTDLEQAVRESELTLIAVGTPLEDGAIGLRFVKAAAAALGRALAAKDDYHVVVVKSTVVPGTTEDCIGPILEASSGKRIGRDFGLGTNPEFLREGEAVADFQTPDRIVLGAVDARSSETMQRLYADFAGVTQIRTTPRTAEMIKYTSNALLATLISFSNEIGNLCSAAPGVDVVDVLGAVHVDKRISPIAADGTRISPSVISYLQAGCGFGGSCFPKDVRALIHWGAENNRSARMLNAVIETNETQPGELLAMLHRHFTSLSGVRVAVLGLAFKPGTDDVRESPALRVVPRLVAEGADVVAYDPIATEPARAVLGDTGVRYADSLDEALTGAEAVVLLTAWDEFKLLPTLLDDVATPPVVIDGRRVLDKTRVRRYEGIGWGQRIAGALTLVLAHISAVCEPLAAMVPIL